MKKTFSKKELKDKALKTLEQFPTAQKVFATVDGNIFLERNRAELHSKDVIYVFDRSLDSEVKSETTKDPSGNKNPGKKTPERISAEDAIKNISEVKSLADLEPYEKDKRATVKAAYETKKEELIKALNVNQ